MGKKKSFIDKKSASTYHLLQRSQRDVGGDDVERESGVVLWPSPENNPETNEKVLKSGSRKNANGSTRMNRLEQNLNQIGLVEDDYDYEKHMKPITGSGDYFEGGHRGNALVDPRARMFDDADDDDDHHVREVDRQLDSIALTPDCMDEDIAQALFGDFEEGDFEEILDDFCITAAEEPKEDEQNQDGDFDYDAHIQQLIENSNKRKVERGIESQNHEWGRQDDAFFSKLKPLHEKKDDYDYDDDDLQTTTPGVVPALSPDEERALCEKFEQTLLEYDSDEVGELDDEDQDLRGTRTLENDKMVQAALDDYLGEKMDDIFIEGTAHLNHRQGGSAFHTLRAGVEAEPEDIKEVIANAQDFLRGPELGVPPEEILIDGKSYFSERQRNPWDVESVLSTYSSLDNNPITIESGSRRSRKKKKNKQQQFAIDEEKEETNPIQIRLSNKTGLPLGVLPGGKSDEYYDYDTIASVNKGIKRDKNETASEKRLRKQQVKQERFMARIQKKMMKEAFSEEFMKAFMGNDELTGKSVFRIT